MLHWNKQIDSDSESKSYLCVCVCVCVCVYFNQDTSVRLTFTLLKVL